METKLLLTGFEPFGGDAFNPSGHIARNLDGHRLASGAAVRSVILPVSGPAAWARLSRKIQSWKPDWVIATGVSGRAEISIETTAWNDQDYRIPDNLGLQPVGLPVLAKGPAFLESAQAEAAVVLTDLNPVLPVRPSTDPGRFVCNHLYYRLLHLTKRPGHPASGRAVFLHLPATFEMRRSGGMEDRRYYHGLEDLQAKVLGLLNRLTGIPGSTLDHGQASGVPEDQTGGGN